MRSKLLSKKEQYVWVLKAHKPNNNNNNKYVERSKEGTICLCAYTHKPNYCVKCGI